MSSRVRSILLGGVLALAFTVGLTTGTVVKLNTSPVSTASSAPDPPYPAAFEPTTHVAMPEIVDVNGVEWRIELVEDIGGSGSGIVGYTNCATRTIELARDGHGERRQSRLIHELSHAEVCSDAPLFTPFNMYFSSTDNEHHEAIYKFAELWAETLYRNPTLGAYLSQREE